MTTKTESLEIYAREINEPITLALFIKGHIYGCNYEKRNKVVRAQYFAPHFLSRRFFSFDDLFVAWGRKKIKQD